MLALPVKAESGRRLLSFATLQRLFWGLSAYEQNENHSHLEYNKNLYNLMA
jgi:hypothetical protein